MAQTVLVNATTKCLPLSAAAVESAAASNNFKKLSAITAIINKSLANK